MPRDGGQGDEYRVNLNDRPKAVLGQLGDRREEIPSSTCASEHHLQLRLHWLRRRP